MKLHSIVVRAAAGELPDWASVSSKRLRHIGRVAQLVEEWSVAAGVGKKERTRWLAAAWLHDCLKDADAELLRDMLDEPLRRLPGPLLHGPAAAARLALEGVRDEELLLSVAYHTLGHPDFGRSGMILYAADFLEPGRRVRRKWRAALRARMPHEVEAVVTRVLRARLTHLLRKGRPIHDETIAFWNRLSGGET